MHILSLTALGLVMAISAPVSVAAQQTQSQSAQNQPRAAQQSRQVRPPRQAQQVRTRRQVVQPNWERCFKMSVDRGFDHDEFGEWRRSIQECLEGKIPL